MKPGAHDTEPAARVAALVLAAGRSARMAGANKLLAELEDKPVVAHVVDAALSSASDCVIVVTGHAQAQVRRALAGREVRFAHNPDHDAGLSSSLRVGVGAVDAGADGVLVCLGDMPRVGSAHLDALIAAFAAGGKRDVCAPVHGGRRGNPVLWPARCFAALCSLEGDVGARGLLAKEGERLRRVEMPDDGVLLDVDTDSALQALRRGPIR